MQRDSSNFDIAAICDVLAHHGVEYVVIGGVAAVLHGADLLTQDFDVVPQGGDANLMRLTEALFDLEAEVSFAGKVRRFPDGDWLLASRTWTFETRLGPFDVLFHPDGAPEYDLLRGMASEQQVGDGLAIQVASLDDLISMKRAAGRPKDLNALPLLEYLRDRQANPPPA